ncbi:MAG: DUF86 domain-containing protein [Candidatus Gastranaerophilaceae bacterium]
MKNRTPQLFFQDILDCIDKIAQYAQYMSYDEFIYNSMAVDAITRNFEVIGEASRHIPEEFKEKYPELPLKEMTGMRNVLIHDYLGVDYQFVWQTIKEDLPQVKEIITRIIKENF